MPIETTHVCPPIPDRSHDWHAHFDWQDCDDLSCEGYGETEESAVIDLLTNAIEVEEDGSEQEEVAEMAIEGWLLQKDKGFRAKMECHLKSLNRRLKVAGELEAESYNDISEAYHRVSAKVVRQIIEEVEWLLE